MFGILARMALILMLSHSVLAEDLVTGNVSIAPSLHVQHSQISKLSTLVTGAEVMHLKQITRVEESELGESVIYVSIHIGDESAQRDYSNIELGFDHFYSDLKLDFANTLSTDGKLYALSKDALQLRTLGGGQDFYSDESSLVFSLPKLAPGSLIEFQYRILDKQQGVPGLVSKQVLPLWFQRTASGQTHRADPVRSFEYQLKVPASMPLTHKVSLEMPAPEVTVDGDYKVTRWNWRDVTSPELVAGMPPLYQFVPYIYSANQQDWQGLATWGVETYLPTDDMIEQVRPIVAQLGLSDDATELEKIKAVYAWVESNVRYVYAHLGRGGFKPHEPKETLAAGYGDCKDQSLLVNSMMRAMGIEALPVLIRTASRAPVQTDLPRNIFDHIFTYLPATEQREGIWFDTTGETHLFPGASAQFEGQPVLILGGEEKAGVKELEMHGNNRADLDMAFSISAEGKLQLKVRTHYEGHPEQSFRQWYIYNNERDKGIRDYLSAIYNDVGQYELDFQAHNADNLFEPFYLTATFTFNNGFKDDENATIAGNARQLLQTFGIYSSLPVVEERQVPYESRFDYQVRMNIDLDVPEGYSSLVLEELESVTTDYFQLKASVKENKTGLLLEGNFPEVSVPADQFAAFSQQIADVYNRNIWSMMLVPDARQSAENQLDLEGKSEFTQALEKARFHLDQGEFKQALEQAQSAIELDAEQAEAWYLLGTAQGMTGDFEASDAAYAKAEALGYRY